jgi:hypothetical protein
LSLNCSSKDDLSFNITIELEMNHYWIWSNCNFKSYITFGGTGSGHKSSFYNYSSIITLWDFMDMLYIMTGLYVCMLCHYLIWLHPLPCAIPPTAKYRWLCFALLQANDINFSWLSKCEMTYPRVSSLLKKSKGRVLDILDVLKMHAKLALID